MHQVGEDWELLPEGVDWQHGDRFRLMFITNLWLRDNRLSGRIPPSLGDLPNLQRVRISGNAFTGCVPGGLLGEPSWYSDAGELGLPECVP